MHLIVFGLGYSGTELVRVAAAAGLRASATSRDPGRHAIPGATVQAFSAPLPEGITHVLSTVPPGEAGDPVLAAHGAALARSPSLRWAGYLSTTGVYGDRAGGWVDETTRPAPGAARSLRRLAAEDAWRGLAGRIAVDLFRTAGIYGPGRSAIEELRAGRARRVLKPGHAFGRIHRDDIVGAVLAAIAQAPRVGPRVLHLADDDPAEPAAVVAEAAALLGLPPPPAIPYAEALPAMSEMARSFWAENRKVASQATQIALGYRWRYPSFREGLRAILAAELSRPAPPPSG